MSDNFLIIDDDAVFARVLAKSLQHHDHNAWVATNEADALDILTHVDIHKIVLDLKLGNESGLTVLANLIKSNCAAKIVIVTGYANIPSTVEAIKLGAFYYVCKPIDTPMLLKAFESTEPTSAAINHDKPTSVAQLEWEHIQRVLAENQGNISATARALNMHRRTLQRKLQKKPSL